MLNSCTIAALGFSSHASSKATLKRNELECLLYFLLAMYTPKNYSLLKYCTASSFRLIIQSKASPINSYGSFYHNPVFTPKF